MRLAISTASPKKTKLATIDVDPPTNAAALASIKVFVVCTGSGVERMNARGVEVVVLTWVGVTLAIGCGVNVRDSVGDAVKRTGVLVRVGVGTVDIAISVS